MLSVAARPCRIAAVRGTVSVLFARESARGFETMTSALFSPIMLRGLTLANRLVVSPMCQYNSNNGSANDWHLMASRQFLSRLRGPGDVRDDQRQSDRADIAEMRRHVFRRERGGAQARARFLPDLRRR